MEVEPEGCIKLACEGVGTDVIFVDDDDDAGLATNVIDNTQDIETSPGVMN
jgi:hypothetical protein